MLADIEPSKTTKSNAASAHSDIRDHLQYHEDFCDRWDTSFLSGSYARDTSIRPKSTQDGLERPDIDIIVLTNYTMDDDPNVVLNEIARALYDDGDGYDVERINKRSVRVETWQAEMDIVPLIEYGDQYLICDRETNGWLITNPPLHKQWSTDQNTLFNGRFKQLVKLMKWWRRENPNGSIRPKGFVLEMLVANHAPKDEIHLGEAFASLLQNIHAAYACQANLGIKPHIDDPAVPGNDILAKVTIAQWKSSLEKIRVHAGYALRAQETDDMEEATSLWRKIFGPRFKTTANVVKAASMGGFASTVAPFGDYTFPNANAAPTKPRGFA